MHPGQPGQPPGGYPPGYPQQPGAQQGYPQQPHAQHGQQPGYPPQHGQQPGPPPGQYPPYQQQVQPQRPAPAPNAAAAGLANPRIQEALTQIDLLAGEQVVYTLQADGFFLGAHPILKMIATMQAFFITLTGGHMRIYFIVTNQRVLVVRSSAVWCGISRTRAVMAIALSGVKEVGSARETHLCCIHTRTVQVQSMTQLFNLVVKRASDQEIRSFVSNLSAVIVAHTSRASV
jgi:hypothetical protein